MKTKRMLIFTFIMMLLLLVGCTNGKKYPDGGKYEGDMKSNMRQGAGIMTFANGDVYEGDWDEDVYSGEGTLTYANGETYSGNWSNGKKNGDGKMTYDNGNEFEGSWVDDQLTGQTSLKYANGDVYTGEAQNGIKNGTGKMIYANGDIYEGLWLEDLKNGQGSMTYASGDIYTGEWLNDTKKGYMDITSESVLVIDFITDIVLDGEIFIDIAEGESELSFYIPGVNLMKIVDGMWCPFAFKTIHIAPNITVPVTIFEGVERDEVAEGTLEFNDVTITYYSTSDNPDNNKIIVSGPDGAVLEKQGNGFILLEGSAYYKVIE